MTADPQFCVPYSMCSDVAKTMRDYNIGPVPIVDAEDTMHLIGIVTDRDLAVHLVARGKDGSRTPVRDIMTTHPIACRTTDDVQRAMKLMEDCQVRRIPVVDDKMRLRGIISQADIAIRLHDPAKTAHLLEEISDIEPNKPRVQP
jgi:CBS domain-containing protein